MLLLIPQAWLHGCYRLAMQLQVQVQLLVRYRTDRASYPRSPSCNAQMPVALTQAMYLTAVEGMYS